MHDAHANNEGIDLTQPDGRFLPVAALAAAHCCQSVMEFEKMEKPCLVQSYRSVNIYCSSRLGYSFSG